MLAWFDQHPALHVSAAVLLTLVAVALATRTWLNATDRDRRDRDPAWMLLIMTVLVFGRAPTWWVTHELNVDESQFIAGALALRHDPVFWRSLETTTSGPLNTYALLPVGTLLGGDSYLSARLTAALLLGLGLLLTHQSLALLYGRAVARIAVVPPLLFAAFTSHDDFLHYSSELVPLALLAVGLHLGIRRFNAGGSWQWNLPGGFVLGAVPLAKLQGAPIAAFIGLAWVLAEGFARTAPGRDRLRAVAALIGGALLPVAGFATLALVTGQWLHAVTSYIANNLWYVEESRLGIRDILADMSRQTPWSSLLKPWLIGPLLWIALAPVLPRIARWSATESTTKPPQMTNPDLAHAGRRILVAGLVALVVVSFICIVSPRRPFPHYWQLMLVPWTLLSGCVLARFLPTSDRRHPGWHRAILPVSLGVIAALILYGRVGSTHPYLGRIQDMLAHPRGAVSAAIADLTHPGESLSVWGWIPTYYVQNGLRPATRDVTTHWAIYPGPHLDYYQERFLDDLRRGRPPVFVDALPPGDDKRHEARFPALGAYVAAHYTLHAEIEGNRIYVRHDDFALAR